MLTLVGSEVVVRRPTDIDRESTSETDAADKEAMPITSRAPTKDADIDTYQAPVALTPANRKNKARVTTEPARESSDNEVAERSKIDVEVVTMEGLEEKKNLKRSALTTGSANKVCTSFVIDLT